MSVRKIFNASAGYTASIASSTSTGPSDTSFDSTSLLLTGDVEVDPSFANVSLLLDGNTLTDKSNNKATITNTGSVTVSSTIKQFGTGSIAFSGSNRLTTPQSTGHNFGSGDFTVECWVNQTSAPAVVYFICNTASSTDAGPFTLYFAAGKPGIAVSTSPPTWNINTTVSTAIPINVWTHVAWVRSGNKWSIYVNGVENIIAASTPLTMITTTDQLSIGSANSNQYYFSGYVDDLRITKGLARYTANFTPPVKALPTHEILDSSVYRLPVTTYGNARIDTTTKKYGTGSMYFDGNGDYLSVPAASAIDFSAAFTIEFWMYPTAYPTNSFVRLLMHNVNNTPSSLSVALTSTGLINSGLGYTSTGIESTTTVPLNNWTHVALSVTGTNGTGRLFLNGVLSATVSGISTETQNVSPLYIGVDPSLSGFPSVFSYYAGYLDDIRITKGLARYTSNFTPPTASLPTIPPTIPADPWWGNVSLLLDGNTTDAYDPYWQNVSLMLTGDDFIDWSNQHNAITNNGTVTLDTTNKKFNSSSLSFNGSSQYFNLPSASGFNTDNFTIELWIRPSSVNTTASFISNRVAGAADTVFAFGYSNAANVGLFFHTQNTTILNTNTFLTQNSWQHVAAVRISGNLKIYLDGNLVGTAAMSQNLSSTNALYIAKDGTKSDGGQTGLFAGQIADLRITKGVARTITVPTTALPSYKIQDRTQNNLTLTPYGNVQLSTDVMKNGTGSMFFDGTGDNVSIANTPYLTLGTTDFTIECWFNQQSTLPYAHLFTSTASYGTANNIRTTLTASAFSVLTGNTGLISGGSFVNGTWVHFALVRTGTTLTLYQNGISVGTATTSVSFVMDTFMVGGEGTYPFNGYIDDFRITKGYARYTQNFTPPSQSFATQYLSTGYDANYADVSLLLNGNGTNGSTTFTDLSSTPKTITAYGNAQISTSVKKYGTGAMYFDGTGDYLSVTSFPLNITQPYTIEYWLYLAASTSMQIPFSNGGGAGSWSQSNGHQMLFYYNSGSLVYQYNYGNAAIPVVMTASSISTLTWYHVAVTYDGTTTRLFVNGTSQSTATNTPVRPTTYNITYVGYIPSADASYFNGYIDDLRVTQGVARYTTNFTPPTYQLPTDTTGTVIDPLRSSTSLLLRGNGTNGSTSFTDESPNGLTVTNNGSVTVNTTTKKYGTGSMAFSGSNYLALTSNVALALGTGDFTVEMWLHTTGSPNDWGIIESRTDGNATTVNGFTLTALSSSVIRIYSNGALIASSATSYLNQWVHVAVTRASGTWNLFINGVSQGTSTGSRDMTNTDLIIGGGRYGSTSAVTSYFTGYIDDLRITTGYARYTANFTPPTYEDPIVTGTVYDYNYPQVSLLLNGDGTNGSTVFKDLSSSPKTITAYGNAQISTAQKKFGTGSMYFDGTGDYLDIPYSSVFNLASVDFTLEAWVNVNGVTPARPILSRWHGGGDWVLAVYGGKIYFGAGANNGGLVNGNIYGNTTLSDNTWYHIAVTVSGTTLRLFLNGVQDNIATNVTLVNTSTNNPHVGQANVGSEMFNGYIDDLRLTKGLARYTANFTPPTAPLPTSYA